MKLYGTFDKQIVQQCQCYVGCLPLSFTLDIRQTEFLSNLPFVENDLLNFCFTVFATKELNEVAQRYMEPRDINKFVMNCRNIVCKEFETVVDAVKYSV